MRCRGSQMTVGRTLVLAALLISLGCGGYGDVSPAAYDFAKAVYSITNRQAADRLQPVSQQVTAAESSGDLSSQEAAWLQDIIEDATRGEWKSANESARRIMEDQVR